MSALDDFVAQSATNYLQSVVFVDDKIYEREGGKPFESSPVTESIGGGLRSQFDKSPTETAASEPVSSEPEYKPAGGVAVGKGDNAKEAAEIATPPYHPRELMESFAQMGICLCSI